MDVVVNILTTECLVCLHCAKFRGNKDLVAFMIDSKQDIVANMSPAHISIHCTCQKICANNYGSIRHKCDSIRWCGVRTVSVTVSACLHGRVK